MVPSPTTSRATLISLCQASTNPLEAKALLVEAMTSQITGQLVAGAPPRQEAGEGQAPEPAHRAEPPKSEEEAGTKSLFDLAEERPQIITTGTPPYCIINVNNCWLNALGYARTEIIGRSPNIL